MARSEKFHWVTVNRDVTPEIPKRFSVSAYPSMLVLGRNEENIHRFSSFMEPPEFLRHLDEGLERYARYRDGAAWDRPTRRTKALTSAGTVRTLGAPSYAVPSGIVALGEDLFVAQGDELFRLDRYGRPMRRQKIRTMTQDLATDGKLLYLVDSAWSKGSPIQVMEPESGRIVREIVTRSNEGGSKQNARGIAWHDGKLWVSEIFGKLHAIDPASGDVVRSVDTGAKWIFGLTFDGEHLAAGGRDAIHRFDPKTGKMAEGLPTNHRLRALGWQNGEFLAMVQPEFGYDRRHKRVQTWPLPGQTMIYRVRPAR